MTGPEIIVCCVASFAFLAVLVGVPVYDREKLQHWRWKDWVMLLAVALAAVNAVVFVAWVVWTMFGGGN